MWLLYLVLNVVSHRPIYSFVLLVVVTVALIDLDRQFSLSGHSSGFLQLRNLVVVGVLLIIDVLCASIILLMLFMQH